MGVHALRCRCGDPPRSTLRGPSGCTGDQRNRGAQASPGLACPILSWRIFRCPGPAGRIFFLTPLEPAARRLRGSRPGRDRKRRLGNPGPGQCLRLGESRALTARIRAAPRFKASSSNPGRWRLTNARVGRDRCSAPAHRGSFDPLAILEYGPAGRRVSGTCSRAPSTGATSARSATGAPPIRHRTGSRQELAKTRTSAR
jgi:hypothetical protein